MLGPSPLQLLWVPAALLLLLVASATAQASDLMARVSALAEPAHSALALTAPALTLTASALPWLALASTAPALTLTASALRWLALALMVPVLAQ